MEKVSEYQEELRASKKEGGYMFNFLTLVDIENLKAILIVGDEVSEAGQPGSE